MKSKLIGIFAGLILSSSLAFAIDPEERIDQDMININTATAEEMDKGLKGVSMKKAEAIVKYREENGNFDSAEDLQKVKGIGERTVEWNERRIIVQ
ncbi:ComEA family DNA-binding protein [Endozoicomonadaceae bacterium StTr2]